jgi:hypothetical protein
MTVTLQNYQKMLGLRIRGRAVTEQCRLEGWRARVEAFLWREVGEQGGAHFWCSNLLAPGRVRTVSSRGRRPDSSVLLHGVDPTLVWLCSLPWRNGGHYVVDVDPLPHWLGLGGSLQLGLCSVSFPLPPTLRGMSAVFTVSLTWWVCVPTPAMDVVVASSCSSYGAGSSWLVPRSARTSTADVGVPVGRGDSSSREDRAGIQRVHGRSR